MEQKKFDFNTFIGMILLAGIALWWLNTNKPDETLDNSTKTEQVVGAISKIKENYEIFEENLNEFSKNFVPNGAENSAKIANQILEEKR